MIMMIVVMINDESDHNNGQNDCDNVDSDHDNCNDGKNDRDDKTCSSSTKTVCTLPSIII